MNNWYVVLTKSREEERAKINLHHQGITAYFPRIEVTRLQRGKPKQLIEPLFPRYMFVLLHENDPGFSKIRYTPGITDFVRFNQQMAKVAPEVISMLKQREASQEKIVNLPAVGDKVVISEGSFKGIEAIIQAKKGEDRVLLLFQLLNQQTQIELEYRQLAVS